MPVPPFSSAEDLPARSAAPQPRVLDGYVLRELKAEERGEALALFEEGAGIRLDAETWAWRFHGRAGVEPLLPAAFAPDGALVGLYPAIERRLQMGSRVLRVAQACHSIVHPQHRARAPLYLALVRRLGDLSAARGIPLGYGGGANEDAVRAGTTLAGYRLLHTLPVLEARLSWKPAAQRRLGRAAGAAVGALMDATRRRDAGRGVEVEAVDSAAARAEDFDALWLAARGAYPVALVRDAAAVDWRWSRCPVPTTLLLAKDGGGPSGYLALRVHDAPWGRCATVLDLLRVPGRGATDALLAAAAERAREAGAAHLRFAPGDAGLREGLRARGWRDARAEPDHVLVRATFQPVEGSAEAAALDALLTEGAWYYAQGDSDFGD